MLRRKTPETSGQPGQSTFPPADVAIVDYSFEGSRMTGVDVVAHLKRQGLREIHMCTGYADDDEVRQAAFDAGADSVIQKDLS